MPPEQDPQQNQQDPSLTPDTETRIADLEKAVSKTQTVPPATIPANLDVVSQANLKKFISDNVPSVYGRSSVPATTSILANTATKVDFGTNNFANGITWDATNKGFKCTLAGTYRVSALVGFFGLTLGDSIDVWLYKNGGDFAYALRQAPRAGIDVFFIEDLVTLASGDIVYLYVRDQINACGISNSGDRTYLTIQKI